MRRRILDSLARNLVARGLRQVAYHSIPENSPDRARVDELLDRIHLEDGSVTGWEEVIQWLGRIAEIAAAIAQIIALFAKNEKSK